MLSNTRDHQGIAGSGQAANLLPANNQRPARVPPWKIGAGLIVCAAVLVSVYACDRWTQFDGASNFSPLSVQTHTSIVAGDRVPVALGVVRIFRNGAPLDPSLAFDQRVASVLVETQLFSHLIYPDQGRPSLEGRKHVTVRLLVNETAERHAGWNAFKGFAIGASLFLLAPFVSLEYDYASQMTLELHRWDGHTKRYTAVSSGTAHYHLFGATPLITEELNGQVTERTLNALMVQLVNDAGLYMAGAAPLRVSPLEAAPPPVF